MGTEHLAFWNSENVDILPRSAGIKWAFQSVQKINKISINCIETPQKRTEEQSLPQQHGSPTHATHNWVIPHQIQRAP